MDDARRPVQRGDHRGAVGDVAVAARDAVGIELPQTVARRSGDVERDDVLALVQQPADNPCADATPGTRDDVSLAHAGRLEARDQRRFSNQWWAYVSSLNGSTSR